MPLDPTIASWLDHMPILDPTSGVDEMRGLTRGQRRLFVGDQSVRVRDLTLDVPLHAAPPPGRSGPDVPLHAAPPPGRSGPDVPLHAAPPPGRSGPDVPLHAAPPPGRSGPDVPLHAAPPPGRSGPDVPLHAAPPPGRSGPDVPLHAAPPPGRSGPDVPLDAAPPPGRSGPAHSVPARLYTPPDSVEPSGLLVFFHGGGWVIGDLDSHDAPCRDLAARTGVPILSIDYRLAPEHPFPAAVEDAWVAVQWAYDHAGDVGADPNRLGVGGDSAGGNLAAVTALMARDAELPLRLQLLVYPVIDVSTRRPSFKENAEGYVLTAAFMEWYEGLYAPERTDWRASPILASHHRRLAPAAVMTCEFDPLRDEGNDYADRLEADGVAVLHKCYPGLIHGSWSWSSVLPSAAALMDDAAAQVRHHLGDPAPA